MSNAQIPATADQIIAGLDALAPAQMASVLVRMLRVLRDMPDEDKTIAMGTIDDEDEDTLLDLVSMADANARRHGEAEARQMASADEEVR